MNTFGIVSLDVVVVQDSTEQEYKKKIKEVLERSPDVNFILDNTRVCQKILKALVEEYEVSAERITIYIPHGAVVPADSYDANISICGKTTTECMKKLSKDCDEVYFHIPGFDNFLPILAAIGVSVNEDFSKRLQATQAKVVPRIENGRTTFLLAESKHAAKTVSTNVFDFEQEEKQEKVKGPFAVVKKYKGKRGWTPPQEAKETAKKSRTSKAKSKDLDVSDEDVEEDGDESGSNFIAEEEEEAEQEEEEEDDEEEVASIDEKTSKKRKTRRLSRQIKSSATLSPMFNCNTPLSDENEPRISFAPIDEETVWPESEPEWFYTMYMSADHPSGPHIWQRMAWFQDFVKPAHSLIQGVHIKKSSIVDDLSKYAYCGQIESRNNNKNVKCDHCDICGGKHACAIVINVYEPISEEDSARFESYGLTRDAQKENSFVFLCGSECGEGLMRLLYLYSTVCEARRVAVEIKMGEKKPPKEIKNMVEAIKNALREQHFQHRLEIARDAIITFHDLKQKSDFRVTNLNIGKGMPPIIEQWRQEMKRK